MEWAALLPTIGNVGPVVAMTLALFIANQRGLIATRREVDTLTTAIREQVVFHERRADEWKAVASTERAAREELQGQIAMLLTATETQNAMFRAVLEAADRRSAP